MICAACRSDNLEGTETCFHCGQPLAGTGALRAIKRGTILAGRYEILSPLGKGGMGMVYKAHDRTLEETVALKVLRAEIATSPDLVRRFRSEIKLARKVSHRNVCRIHEYGLDGELSFISMELVDGTDLKRVLRERGALPVAEALEVAINVCEGLAAIHEVGIVHRDLKTANLMRDSAGLVKLMDFGIAKQTGAGAEGLTSATATGQIIGTPEYMSPEQARGEKLDARSDIYALGIVIFELFTGSVPFRGDTPIATILKHIREPPPLDDPSVTALPASVVAVMRRALAKEPADRFASVREMTDVLRAGAAGLVAGRTQAVPAPSRAAAVPQPRPEPLTSATPVPTSVPTAVPTAPRQAIPETRRVDAPRLPAAPARPPATLHGGFTSGQLWLVGGGVVAVAVLAAVAVGLVLLQLARRAPTSTAERPSPSESAVAVAAASPAPSPLQSVAPDLSPPIAAPTPRPTREPATARPSPRIEPTTAPAARPSSLALAPAPQPTPLAHTPPPQTVATPAPTPLATPREVAPPPTPAPSRAAPSEAPAAAPRRPEGRGLLAIEVKPEAEIVIDGTVVGRMKNYTAPLDAGIHTIIFRHPKYEPLQRKVEIAPQEKARLVVDLKDEGRPAKK